MLPRLTNLKIAHKGYLIALVPIVSGLLFFASLMWMLEDAERTAKRKALAAAINHELATIGQLDFDIGNTLFTYAFTHQEVYAERYETLVKKVEKSYQTLIDFFKDRPEELKLLKHAHLVHVRYLQLCAELKVKRDMSDTLGLMDIMGMRDQIQALLRQFGEDISLIQAQQAKFEKATDLDPEEARARAKYLIWFGFFSSIFLGLVLVAFYSKSITKPIELIMDNAVRLAARQPLHNSLQGADEIGKLDRIFHRMADSLAEAARRERAIVTHAADVICSIDSGYKFTEISPAAEAVWGYLPDELLGKRIVEIIADDIEVTLQTLKECEETEAELSVENIVKRKDGSFVDMLWSVQWSREEKSHFLVAHDITARKAEEEILRENEARVRLIIESMPVALLVCSNEGIIEMTNIACDRVLGYRFSDLIGEHLSRVFPVSKAQSNEAMMETFYQEFVGRARDLDARKKDDKTVPVELSVSRFELGDEQKFLCAALDVTERHNIERMRQELVQMVSHDLRSPLTSIMGNLELVQTPSFGSLNERGATLIKRCDADLERLISLIDNLLDLDKLQAGKLEVNLEVIDMASVVARSVSAVSFHANKSNIEIVTPKESLEAFADGPKLVQVIVNLLSNAIKFSPQNSTITIAYAEKDDCLEVKLTDQGRGIAADFVDKVFERFEQVERADHHEKGGKGLGLAICKAIIEAHGGNIGVTSEVGKGSTFWFKIPQPS